MPPGTSEVRHHHLKANQFFYVLHGTLSFEVGSPKASKEFDLNAGQGIEIIPGEIHQVRNRSASDVEFLVISNPPSHGDRISSE
jgi:mannose-6-phosphate isomerase-like protein (cupin superfamily)